MNYVSKDKKNKSLFNVFILWIGTFIGSGSIFLLSAFLSRYLSVVDYGLFSTQIVAAGIVILISEFGASQTLLKLFSKNENDFVAIFANALLFILFSTLLFSCVFVIILIMFNITSFSLQSLIFLSIYIFSQVLNNVVIVTFQFEDKFFHMSVLKLYLPFLRLVTLLLMAYCFKYEIVLNQVFNIYGIVGAISILLSLIFINSFFQKNNFNCHNLKQMTLIPLQFFNETKFFGISIFASYIYTQISLVMINIILGNESAGYFQPANLIYLSISILPAVFYQSFFALRLHNWANRNMQKLKKSFFVGNIVMFLIGLFISAFIFLFANDIIYLVFGDTYVGQSTLILKIISLSFPFIFMSYNMGAILNTRSLIEIKYKISIIIAFTALILNFVLISKYGIIGAAIVYLLINFILCFLYYLALHNPIFNNSEKIFS